MVLNMDELAEHVDETELRFITRQLRKDSFVLGLFRAAKSHQLYDFAVGVDGNKCHDLIYLFKPRYAGYTIEEMASGDL